MAAYYSGKGAKKLSVEEKATIIAFRKASMKIKDIIAHTGCNTTTITRILAASRVLGDQGLPQRKTGSGSPRKVTNMVLKSLKRHINKYLSMTAGQLRAMVPEVAALYDRSVGMPYKKT
jgi:hypothetical protein